MPVYPVSDDDHIGAALNVARNPDPMGDTIQNKIGGLNQALTGLDLEANTPNFHTGIGGAGMPSRVLPSRPSNAGEDLFDYSRLHEIPNVSQVDLERYVPARGVPARVQDVMANKDVRDKMLQTILEGQQKGGANWYNADPLRDKFIENLGATAGNQAFRKYMDMVAATSPRSDVGTNVRNASYYYQKAMAGEPMPEVGTPNPQPYGHMAQRLHQMNAQRVAGEGWDALNNPKPASFVENLVGNQAPVTVDTHAFRLPAIHAGDPRFLETAFQVNKDAPKQNIQKMVTSGEMPLDEALNRAAYWQAQPKENEYGAMEQYYKSLGKELGLSPAQTQASAWVGGGKLTGLASDESKPFLRFFQDRIYKTANELKMDPNDVMDRFIKGEMTLRASGGRTLGNNAIDNAMRMAIGGDAEIEMPHSLKELQDWKKNHSHKAPSSMDDIFTRKMSGVEGADPIAMPANLDELLAYLRKHHASGGRSHFDDGGDVRGGDSVGGLRGDTGGYSGNQGAANEGRMGDSPGGFGGDTGRYSSGDVGREQGRQNEQTARDQWNQQNERQAQQNNPEGYSVRTGDVPGGLGGDTGRYSGATNAAQGQQDAFTAALQGNIQRQRESNQRAFDDYMKRMQGVESEDDINAVNKITGAFGKNQLLPSTALSLARKYAPEQMYGRAVAQPNPILGIPSLTEAPTLSKQQVLANIKASPSLQDQLTESLTRENMNTLSSRGIPINDKSLYAAHLLGAGDALKVLQSDPNTPLEQTGINPRAIENNRLAGLTAGQLLDRSGAQMASAAGLNRPQRTADNLADVFQGSPAAAPAPDGSTKFAIPGEDFTTPTVNPYAGFASEDPALIAAYNAATGANGPKNAYADMTLGQRAPSVVDANGNISRIQSIGNALTDFFTPSYGINSPEYNKISQAIDVAREPSQGRNGQEIIKPPIMSAYQPQATAAVAPYISQLGTYNAQLPSTTGETAEQWAAANTNGDMSKVNGRIKYVNGAPRLEYYAA
jgi:hypothetical protein